MSYSSFCRFRPFWIVQRKSDARETCLCKLHENIKYRVEKLYRLGVIQDSNPDIVVNQLMCDNKCKECAYRDCSKCQDKGLDVCTEVLSERKGEQVQYQQWTTRTENYESKDGTKTIQKTVKVTEQDTVETLLVETQTLLKDKYAKHVFNIKHQYITLKQVKENLDNSTAIMHVDFSENYTAKLASEVQSMHFGGSHKQVSLHTVVVYTKDSIKSICTVSENTYHGPGAIWAHLTPVLQYIKLSYPDITTIHFVSDGPCTQYRSKNHFFMLHRHILGNFEFEIATWNFTESGHGKSAADGVGGTVKRTADRLVATGTDIPDAKAFYENVGKHLENVQLFLIESDDIESLSNSVPKDLKTVKGTMKLHQVTVSKHHRGIMLLKELSCFCNWPNPCSCYEGDVSEHSFPAETGAGDGTPLLNQPVSEPDVTKDITTVDPHPDMVGTWCVIRYEGEAYPGIIQDIDDKSAEVNCMCRIGENRFFWPLVKDVIWYSWSDVLMNIQEPRPVTSSRGSRHVQVDPECWNLVRAKLANLTSYRTLMLHTVNLFSWIQ
ncbi:uncharacterized protein LOC123536521 [Mercenaria mercenaria]|uniref:uncharacterized protein LOC123536521 n=1 Tax=Mercenaria mercenaria TaxID=6596 RepID=UPI00234EC744|nr:uncharacterized protein LOC123536521 [Mercenaria mercenaria]